MQLNKRIRLAKSLVIRQGTAEEKAVVNLKGGQAAEIMIDYLCTSPPPGPDDDLAKLLSQPALMRGLVCLHNANMDNIMLTNKFSVLAEPKRSTKTRQ